MKINGYLNSVLSLTVLLMINESAWASDEFYQWNLENDGTTIQRDFYDIHSVLLRGKLDFDAGVSGISQLSLSRVPVVAVLDTGLDLDHPEFADKIWKNEAECENGKLPARPTQDKDGNGYVGDCMGWNFLAKNHRTYDNEQGHGTHIAGIIAAARDGVGIAGIDERIKILPVNIIGRSRANSRIFADAINYAVSRKVDVINLSLGWPEILNSSSVASAIRNAIDNGVFIVAAAGNNSHNRPIFPCAYDEVVCVGSADPDGSSSSFSNEGPMVDILGPGYSILSTIPRKNRSQYLQVKGYDYRSGTSQAAPHVAAALALLKARFPSARSTDILARLFGNARPRDDESKSLFGMVNIEGSMRSRPSRLFWPKFDRNFQIEVDASGKFALPMAFKNLSNVAANAQVSVKGLPSGISLSRRQMATNTAAVSADANVRFQGTALSTAESRVTAVVELKSGGGLWRFPIGLQFVSKWKSQRTVSLGSSTDVFSCSGPLPCYYQKNSRSLTITTINQSFASSSFQVPLPTGATILGVQTTRRNGQEAFILQTREGRNIKLRLFSRTGQNLLGPDQSWTWTPEYASPNGGLRWWWPQSAETPIPYFMTRGPLPDLDRDDFAGGSDSQPANHLYMLLADSRNKLVTRAIDSEFWRDDLADILGLRFNDFIDLLAVHQNSRDELYMVISTGRGVDRAVFLIPVEQTSDAWQEPGERLDLAMAVRGGRITLPSGSILTGNTVVDVKGGAIATLPFLVSKVPGGCGP